MYSNVLARLCFGPQSSVHDNCKPSKLIIVLELIRSEGVGLQNNHNMSPVKMLFAVSDTFHINLKNNF